MVAVCSVGVCVSLYIDHLTTLPLTENRLGEKRWVKFVMEEVVIVVYLYVCHYMPTG